MILPIWPYVNYGVVVTWLYYRQIEHIRKKPVEPWYDEYVMDLPNKVLKPGIVEWLEDAGYPYRLIATGRYMKKPTKKTHNLMISFDETDHAMMFKLAWCGTV